MNEQDSCAIVIRALTEVAPEVDPAAIDPDATWPSSSTSTRWTSSTSWWRSTSRPGSRSPSATIRKLSTLNDAVAYLARAQAPAGG